MCEVGLVLKPILRRVISRFISLFFNFLQLCTNYYIVSLPSASLSLPFKISFIHELIL
jgi:hypothetical protein